MTDNDKATPRPWRLSDTPELFIAEPNGRPVAFAALYSRIDDNKGPGEGWLDMMERTAPERKKASDEKEANAALIVRAVNAYDNMLAALNALHEIVTNGRWLASLPREWCVSEEVYDLAYNADLFAQHAKKD